MSRSLTEFPKDIDRQRRGAAAAAKTQREKRKRAPGPLKEIGVKVGESGIRPNRTPFAEADFTPLENAWRGMPWE